MVALAPSQIVKEQVQAGEDVGETFVTNVDKIEVDLETNLMIKEHENVVHAIVLEKENANEDVEPHAHIDGTNILNFTYYNLLPHLSSHPSSSGEDGWGSVFFCQIYGCNTFINYGP